MGSRYRLSWRVDDAGIVYFWVSAAIPFRSSSLILAARLPSDPSIAAMMSASVRRLSLAVISKVFCCIQAFFASLSAIDFYLLLWYILYATCRELALPTGGLAAPEVSGKSVNRIGELPLLAGFGGRLFHYQACYVNTQGNGRYDKQ